LGLVTRMAARASFWNRCTNSALPVSSGLSFFTATSRPARSRASHTVDMPPWPMMSMSS